MYLCIFYVSIRFKDATKDFSAEREQRSKETLRTCKFYVRQFAMFASQPRPGRASPASCVGTEAELSSPIFWSLKRRVRAAAAGLVKLFVDCKLYLWHLADNQKYLRL